MTPLQKVAVGLGLVVLTAPLGGYDLVPDPVGWVFVLLGLRDLREPLADQLLPLVFAAGLALAASLVVYPPVLDPSLSARYFLGLPQAAFLVLLCTAVARLAEGDDAKTHRRFRLLRGVFLGLLVAPVVVVGGGVEPLVVPLAVAVVVADVYLVYTLFRVSRRAYALP